MKALDDGQFEGLSYFLYRAFHLGVFGDCTALSIARANSSLNRDRLTAARQLFR
jgi:hypothetical protein